MGTTVLDSFVLEFGLDASKFSAGQKELMEQMKQLLAGTKKGGDEVEALQKKMLDVFSIMRREGIVALGGFLGAREIVETISHFTKLENSVARLGHQMGMSAQEVLAWGNAFKSVGADPASGISALTNMEAQLQQYNITKQAPAMGIWAALGVSPTNATGMKNPEEMWLDLATALERRGGDPRAKAGFLRMAGADQGTVNFLMMGSAAIKKAIEEHKALNPQIDRYTQNLAKLQEQLGKVDTAWQSVGISLTNLLAGPLTKFFDVVAKVMDRGAKGIEQLPPKSIFGRMLGALGWETGPGAAAANKGGVPKSNSEKLEWMKEIFGAAGVSPMIAYSVAGSEGLNSYVSKTDFDKAGNPNSFGDFQLHYSGDPKRPALGDLFTKETGKHASDPSTTRAQYEFIAKWVKKHGWSDFHGWKGSPFAGVGKQSGMTINNNNSVTVNDKSGEPGKQAGIAIDHINRANLAYGVGTVAQG